MSNVQCSPMMCYLIGTALCTFLFVCFLVTEADLDYLKCGTSWYPKCKAVFFRSHDSSDRKERLPMGKRPVGQVSRHPNKLCIG